MLEEYFDKKHNEVEAAVTEAELPKHLRRVTFDIFHDARYTFQNIFGKGPENKASADYTQYYQRMCKFQKRKAMEYVEIQTME